MYAGNIGSIMSVYENSVKISSFELLQNFPKPFNPTTAFSFWLACNSHTTLNIIDVYGRKVAVLGDGERSASTYSEQFNEGRLASGVHYAQLRAASFNRTVNLVLTKLS